MKPQHLACIFLAFAALLLPVRTSADAAQRVATVHELIAAPGPILRQALPTKPAAPVAVTLATTVPATVPAGITIYVAADGNDLTGDGTQAHPYETMKKAQNKMRLIVVNGRKTVIDKMRLHVGDTFDNPQSALIGWNNVDGVNIDVYQNVGDKFSKAIIGSNGGSGLTLLHCNNAHVANLLLQADHRNPAIPTSLIVTSNGMPLLADRSNGYSPGDGFYMDGCSNYDVEDVTVQFYQNGFTIQGDHCQAGTIARCEAYDCYSTNKGFSQGFFIQGQVGLTLDHPAAVRCGWCKQIPEAPATMFSHGFYMRPDGGQGIVTLVEPVAIGCASSGVTADCGAIVIGGLSVSNSNAANAPNIWVGNVHSEIHGHTSIDGEILFLAKTGEMEGCVVSPHGTLQPMEVGIQTPALARAATDVVKVHDNVIVGWDGAPVTIRPNQGGAAVQLQGNRCVLSRALAERWLGN